MTEYHNHGVTLTKGQAKKIYVAQKKGPGVSIRLSKNNLHGDFKLPLTQTQLNKIKKAKSGVQLNLSESQLNHMEKTGGFIPLLTLIPIIASALGAAGGVAGGVASAVNSKKANDEQARHNRVIEESIKSGSGVVSDVVGKVPVIGTFLASVLQKMGLGIKDINKMKRGGCVCRDGWNMKFQGSGLFLEPHGGEGLFLGPER